MLIIPEIECVVITPPRTGSTGLRKCVLEAYPKAFSPYRHGERDLIPRGYRDDYHVMCVIRHPIERLWSLYKYIQTTTSGSEEWRTAQREALQDGLGGWLSFDTWLMTNETIFAGWTPREGPISPPYMLANPMPENGKSQAVYARGAETIKMESGEIYKRLSLRPLSMTDTDRNTSSPEPRPELSDMALDAIWDTLSWDFRQYAGN